MNNVLALENFYIRFFILSNFLKLEIFFLQFTYFPFAVQKVQKLNFQGGLSFGSTVL
jgi:hypothetical protein